MVSTRHLAAQSGDHCGRGPAGVIMAGQPCAGATQRGADKLSIRWPDGSAPTV